jgi:hypothetical protein
MAFTTKLRTNHKSLQGLHWGKPHRDFSAGDRVLLNPHRNDAIVMNHILGANVENYRFIHRQLENWTGEIIERIRVSVVDAKVIGPRDQRWVMAPKLVVRTRVMVSPSELPTHHTDAQWIQVLNLLPAINPLSPEWKCKPEKQDCLDDNHANFQVARKMTPHPLIRRLWVVFMPEPENAVKEKQGPPHEQRDHEPMNYVNHVINLTTVR